jgi:REP element-mobilizing transposase RayT
MASTFTNLLFHVIFSTKFRKPLVEDSVREELYCYIGGIIREQRGSLLEIGGMPDHVHILARLSPTIAISDVLKLIKANSSKWMNERGGRWKRFQWQTGYAAFSVSESRVADLRRYIQGQAEHHRTKTFREEYVAFLKKHKIDFEERYAFEEEHVA